MTRLQTLPHNAESYYQALIKRTTEAYLDGERGSIFADLAGWSFRTGIAEKILPLTEMRYSPDLLHDLAGGAELPRLPDYLRFRWGGPDLAAYLLATLPNKVLADTQNLGPTNEESLLAASKYPEEIGFHGYYITPLRSDERITIDTLVYYGQASPQQAGGEWWPEFAQKYGIRPDVREPDDVYSSVSPDLREAWLLWWD